LQVSISGGLGKQPPATLRAVAKPKPPKNMSITIEKEARQRGSEKPLFVVRYTLANFDKLPDDARADILYEALVNICCRSGKQADELIGKVLTFADCALFLAKKGERQSGKPSKEDEKNAAMQFASLLADAKAAEDEDSDLWADVRELIEKAGEKVQALTGTAFEWADVEKKPTESFDEHAQRQAITNLARIRRNVRVHREREQARKAEADFASLF